MLPEGAMESLGVSTIVAEPIIDKAPFCCWLGTFVFVPKILNSGGTGFPGGVVRATDHVPLAHTCESVSVTCKVTEVD